MSLDLSTLKVGDKVRCRQQPKGSPDSVVEWISSPQVLVSRMNGLTDRRHARLLSENALAVVDDTAEWDVVPPVPPCPITEPLTIVRRAEHTSAPNCWAPVGEGHFYKRNPSDTAEVTLHPPGTSMEVADDAAHYGIWTSS